jgi:hypothetical protein
METNQAQAEDAVRTVLRERLGPLAGLGDEQGTNHNPFLEAISPSVAAASKLTRSLTSRLGRRLAAIARELAVAKYGPGNVPSVMFSDTIVTRPAAPAALVDDTAIYTQLDENEVRNAAIRLLRWAGSELDQRIGTERFREKFIEEVTALRRQGRAAEPWFTRVDLYVDSAGIGLAELESGGELDSSNVKGQPEKLVLAALALGSADVPLHFCLAYANRGEGESIAGQLPKYFAPAGDLRGSGGLLIGSQWWSRLLPVDVSFDRFLEIFREVAAGLHIVPDEVERADQAFTDTTEEG